PLVTAVQTCALPISLRLDSGFAPALMHLGVVRWQQKQLPESHDLLSRAVQANPQDAQGRYYFARVLEDEKQTEPAIKELRQAVRSEERRVGKEDKKE